MRKELNDLADECVFKENQMLGHVLEKSEEAALGVEPRVGAELLLVRLQALHDARNAEFVVAFGAVQGSLP